MFGHPGHTRTFSSVSVSTTTENNNEPGLFNTVQRPEIENKLIPTTWHENGALLYGKFDSVGLEYTAGVVNALNINNADTKNAEDGWIRDGRLGASNKAPFDPAFVGRLDYTGINGLIWSD